MVVALRYLKRVFAALLILLLVIIAGVAIYFRTGAFNHILHDRATAFLSANYRGQITFQRIDASVIECITITNISVVYHGEQVMHIPLVRIHYSLIPLLWDSLHVRLGVFTPVINLQRQNEKWNLLEAISPRTASKTHTFAVRLRAQVHNGTIEMAPQGPSGSHYHLDNVAIDLSASLTSAGMNVSLNHLVTRIKASGFPQAELTAALAYNGALGRVNVSHATLTTHNSALAMSGSLNDFNRMNVHAVLTIEKLAASDIAAVVPVKVRTGMSGTIIFHGPKNAMHADVTLQAGEARMSSQILTNLAARVPHYNAKIQIASLDLNKLLGGGNPTGVIAGTITAHGSKMASPPVAGQAQLTDRGAGVASVHVGDIVLKVTANNGAAQFSGLVTNGPSQISLNGQSQLAAGGRYRLTLAASRLDLRRFLASNNTQPSDLNFTLDLDGRGFQLAQMNDDIRMRLMRSRIAGVKIDRGALDARIAKQRAEIARSMLAGAGFLIEAHGNAGLSATAPLRLAYHLQSSNIAPLLKLKNLSGEGELNVIGTASGRLGDLSAQGDVNGKKLVRGKDSIAHAYLTYHLAALGRGIPNGRIMARLEGINAPVKFKRVDAAIVIGRGKPVPIHLALDSLDSAGRASELAAEVRYRPQVVEGRLERAALALPDGVWRLYTPASFSEDAKGLTLAHLRIRNGPREVAVNGNLAWQGAQHLTLTLRGLELADFASIVQRKLSGELAAQVEMTGTAAAPLITASVSVSRLRMSGQSIGAIDFRAHYATRQVAVNALFAQDSSHQLSAVGTIPASLQWAHGFSARIGNAMDIKVYSAGLNMGPLAAFAPGSVKNAAGILAVDLVMRGPVQRPAANGTIRVNGRAHIVPLGIEVTNLVAVVRATPNQILVQLSAKSGTGTLNGRGTVAISEYTPGQINAQVNFHNWPAIGTREYQARIDGQIVANGTTDAPRIGGQIDITHSVIRPDLAFLSATSDLTPDPTIEVIEPGQTAATAAKHPRAAPSSFNRIAMDVLVRISRRTWIRHENAQIELEGKVRVLKQAHQPLRLVGAINTVHGWIIFQNRQFNLVSGTVTFTGGHPINPSLAVTAQYVVNNYTVDVVAGGSASEPSLKLTSIPQLTQTDILSLLLFGKTSTQLAQGQTAALQQQAASMAAGAAASTIGGAVMQSLGLQGTGLQLSGVGASGATVGLGHYIGNNTYISFSQQVGGNTTTSGPNQGVSIQYYILNWLSVKSTSFSDGSREIDLTLTKQY
ncbi:MAG: translocation/assembly module TamB domain-containing protein [Candidatus Binataceae bacterium]